MKFLPTLVMGCYALILLCVGAGAYSSFSDGTQADGYAMRLTVVTPAYESATSIIAPFGPGYERDLLAEFCKPHNCDIRWVQAPHRAAALDMLRAGKADMAVGFAGDETAGQGLAASPPYYHTARVEVRVSAQEAEAADKGRKNPAQAAKTEQNAQEEQAEQNEQAEQERLRNYWLDERSWALWEPFSPLDKRADARVSGPSESYRWFWRTYNPSLHHALAAFWEDASSPENPLLAQLEERYYGYLSARTGPYAVMDLMSLLKRRLPRYSDIIAKASDRADINPLLFTAVIIQESRLDEGTVSHTGVRGIMQLTQETAAFLKVDRMDPKAAIGAGARYLQMLWKDLEPLELDEWDRWFFTLAAFNQGPRRLEGAMELSRKLGGTGRTWTELKEVYPLLAQKKYASMVGQSTCRGQEAVNFVERVRWSYHILRGLVALDRPEAENLAPLLASIDRNALGL